MDFVLRETLRGAPDETLLEELRRAAKLIGRETITMAQYERVGKTHPSTLQRRFGSWPNALTQAGLKQSRSRIGISNLDLLVNLKSVWEAIGRQPTYKEMTKPLSIYSAATYEKAFGSWTKSLTSFAAWVQADVDQTQRQETDAYVRQNDLKRDLKPERKQIQRHVTDRLRFSILVRDGFRCTACGASPIDRLGVQLHVDHINPWSKGGETTLENLTTRCKTCNLGKGNAFSL